ncbi:iron-containing alcohol dehydrogenase [Streptomyces sp. WZ.A104]|nr:iron-containing alcohol dehydrogenase [Streptomyces sp. WZ.A104]
MRQYEEVEEQARISRELVELLDDLGTPQGLGELGYDPHSRSFRGERIA